MDVGKGAFGAVLRFGDGGGEGRKRGALAKRRVAMAPIKRRKPEHG